MVTLTLMVTAMVRSDTSMIPCTGL
jgi:hypothetical protein